MNKLARSSLSPNNPQVFNSTLKIRNSFLSKTKKTRHCHKIRRRKKKAEEETSMEQKMDYFYAPYLKSVDQDQKFMTFDEQVLAHSNDIEWK